MDGFDAEVVRVGDVLLRYEHGTDGSGGVEACERERGASFVSIVALCMYVCM